MTERDEAGSGWRARWARRENKRRWRTYEDTLASWYLRGIRLLRLRAAAENLPAESADDLPVELAPGETVLAVHPEADLVEVEVHRHVDLPTVELAVIPVRRRKRGRRLPHGVRVTDTGTVVITDRRVVLLGREGERVWPFPLLSGLAHYPTAPITLLHTIDGRPLAGLRVPLTDAARFRLRLTMAYATFVGQRRLVLARLDEAVAANRRSRPPVPVVVTAEQAPARAHPAIVAAAVALVAVPAYAMTADSLAPQRPPGTFDGAAPDTPPVPSLLPEPPTDPGTASATPATPTPEATTGAATSPGRTTGATTGSGRAAGAPTGRPADRNVPRRPAPKPRPAPRVTPPPPAGPGPARPGPTRPGPVRPTPAPPTTTAPPPVVPVDRCGAPQNPYGYNYCGGTLVHQPALGICFYFTCVEGFWEGRGHLTVCEDGRVGMVGGPTGRCPERAGRKEPVYAYQPAAS